MQLPAYGEPILKTLHAKNVKWTWMTLDDILLNETLCLHRLCNTPGFPQLISTNWVTHEIAMTCVGRTLHWYWKRGLKPTVINPLEQLTHLFRTLESHNIIHLDLGIKNLCLHEGDLSIIDYGIAVRDGKPGSDRIATLLRAFHNNGGYEHALHLILSQIYNNCEIKKT